jgi:multicomponent Na+:H+ antiporter subunit B
LKFLYLMLTLVTGGLLIYGALDMPNWGDPHSPANSHVSPRYIEDCYEETHVPNMVTAVLADYRGFDTLGETTVVFAAGIGVLLILRKPGREKKKKA